MSNDSSVFLFRMYKERSVLSGQLSTTSRLTAPIGNRRLSGRVPGVSSKYLLRRYAGCFRGNRQFLCSFIQFNVALR